MKTNFLFISVLLIIGSSLSYTQENMDDNKMQIPASKQEMELFFKKHVGREYFAFTEDRTLSVRMLDALPKHWCKRDKKQLTQFTGQARPGEFYTFQIGMYSPASQLEDIQIAFNELVNNEGVTIDKDSFRCFNLGGIDYMGIPFTKRLNVPAGRVQPLWIGVQIPLDASGIYEGELVLSSSNKPSTSIHLNIGVYGPPIPNGGTNEGWRMARLKWLDSRIAQDDGIVEPYVPLKKDDLTISFLGRSMTILENGLPAAFQSFFSNSVTKIGPDARDIISAPFRFIVDLHDGESRWKTGKIEFTHISEGTLKWEVESKSKGLILSCKGKVEFDGFVVYELTLKAVKELDIKDIRLEIPIENKVASYMMGLGRRGGACPSEYDWQWDKRNAQDAVWIGDVNAGIRCKFKGENYRRSLTNIYYEYGPLNIPVSWGNQDKGGISLKDKGQGTMLLSAFCGDRRMKVGEELHFDFELLVTPVKTINLEKQFSTRFIHTGSVEEMMERAVRDGANVINIHHSRSFNPFINYPYYDESVDDFREYIKEAHKKDLKVKPYYTTRELTVNLPELWAFRSLGDEIIFPGPGNEVRTILHKNGPDPWLQENLKQNYIPAWVARLEEGKYAGKTDLSVVTTPDTRLNNFYLEGLDWMVKGLDIDGIYIDCSALEHESLKRTRKILDRNKAGCNIDFHSWDEYQELTGWNNSMNMYMELFPFIDRIWFGESYDYDRNPEYWLTEISGIPFGIMGEMLRGGGNPWRGMVYGMTNRIYIHNMNPVSIWKFMDKYDMGNMEMIGYWDPDCPVKTNNENLRATVYRKQGTVIVSIGNWSKEEQDCSLEINWSSLQIDKKETKIYAPFIQDFQEAQDFEPGDPLIVKGAKGCLLLIQESLSTDTL